MIDPKISENQENDKDSHQTLPEYGSEDLDSSELENIIVPEIIKVEELEQKIVSLEEQLLRTAAESENVRRRYEKMIDDAKLYSISNFAKDLLGVMDNLTRALECEIIERTEKVENMIAGVEMTKRELESVFKRYGLESILPAIGEKFDYNQHHAISQIVTDESEHDSIMSVIQAGYKIKDRLLRPAMVAVAKKSE